MDGCKISKGTSSADWAIQDFKKMSIQIFVRKTFFPLSWPCLLFLHKKLFCQQLLQLLPGNEFELSLFYDVSFLCNCDFVWPLTSVMSVLWLQILSFYGRQVSGNSLPPIKVRSFPGNCNQSVATASWSAIALKIDPVQKIRIYDVWSPSDVKHAFLFVYFLPSVQPLFENFGFEDLLVSTLGASFTATKLKLFSSSLWNLPIFLIWNFYPFWFRIDYFSSCLKKNWFVSEYFFWTAEIFCQIPLLPFYQKDLAQSLLLGFFCPTELGSPGTTDWPWRCSVVFLFTVGTL